MPRSELRSDSLDNNPYSVSLTTIMVSCMETCRWHRALGLLDSHILRKGIDLLTESNTVPES